MLWNKTTIVSKALFRKKTIIICTLASMFMIGTAYAFLGTFWTHWHSEENQPAMCADDTSMTRIECSGGYCDNVRAKCETPPREHGSYYFTSYKSEEQGRNMCANGYNVTGIDCQGAYCDNQSLQCTRMYGGYNRSCEWLGPFSEEGPRNYRECPDGKYITGTFCSGAYCDNKYIHCCET